MRLLLAVRGWIGRAFLAALDRPLTVVAITGTIALGLGWFVSGSPPATCLSLPVSLIRLEVTFDAAKFSALLAAEGRGCRDFAIAGMGWRDILYSIAYPFALAALGVWVMRWRCRHPDNARYEGAPLGPWRFRVLTVAPFIAGALDIIEDLFLSAAAHQLVSSPTASPPQVLVFIGSLASSVKWILLGLWLVAAGQEWLAGPRGRVLGLTRFSTLAVVLGALPLLAVPQGQDILQRLAEANVHPYVRVSFGVIAMVFVATAVWYVSRRLLQQGFEADSKFTDDPDLRLWLEHYAVNIPRIQGTAMIVLGGLAFARAGMRVNAFIIVAILGFAIATILDRVAARADSKRTELAPTAADSEKPSSAVTVRRALREEGFQPRFIAALVSIPLGLFIATRPTSTGLLDDAQATFALRIGAAGCVVASWLFFLFIRYRRTVMAARKSADSTQPPSSAAPAFKFVKARPEEAARGAPPAGPKFRLSPSVWTALAVSFVVLFVFTLIPVPVARFIGPLWVLALFTANTVLFGAFAVFVYERFSIPLVRIAIGFAFLFGLWNENHSVRLLRSGAPPATRDSLASRLEQFLTARAASPGGKDRPIVLVAAAGGGLRAAYWSATTLAAIQDGDTTFATNVFAMSGVSGGSLGVALFDAIVRDAGAAVSQFPCAHDSLATRPRALSLPGGYSQCARVFLRDDFLAPVLAKMLVPDLAQRFVPFTVDSADRSTALEGSWETSYRESTGRNTFAEGLGTFAKSATVPVLLLNSTHVETGKRYIAGTVTFDSVLADTRDVLTLLGSDIRMSSAVHNSARFTYVSPAGHLDRRDSLERGRVVDGGYFENSGLVTLGQVYAVIKQRHPELRVIAVYLCNDPVTCHTEADVGDHTDGSTPKRDSLTLKALLDSIANAASDSVARTHNSWANELLAPVRAVLDARDARGALALAEMRDELDTNFIQLNVCDRLTRVNSPSPADTSQRVQRARDRVVSPPLGWSLSRLAGNWMDASMLDAAKDSANGSCPEHNRRMIDRLRKLR